MAPRTAVAEILAFAARYPTARWLVVASNPDISAELTRSGAKLASKPTEASGVVLADTMHQLSTEELTTLAAFLREGHPFIVSAPNSAHGSLRLAALANQDGNEAALPFDRIVDVVQGCGVNIVDIAAVSADVLESESSLDITGFPTAVFDWLRNQDGALDQRYVVLGERTDSPERTPLPPVRTLGNQVRPSRQNDEETLTSERERQARAQAEAAEERVRELKADGERLTGEIQALTAKVEAQQAEFAERIEAIRAEFEEEARKEVERRIQESSFASKAALKTMTKAEKRLRAELEEAEARIAELEAARGGVEAPKDADELGTVSELDEVEALLETAVEGEADSEPESEVESEPEVEVKSEIDFEPAIEPEVESEVDVEPEPYVAPEAQPEPKLAVDPMVESEAESEPEVESVTEAESEVGLESTPKDDVAIERDDVEPEAEPAPEPEAAPEEQKRSRFGRFFGR